MTSHASRQVRNKIIGYLIFLLVLALIPLFTRIGLVTEFVQNLLMYSIIFAIAGLAFNILLGYSGLLSFGHAAYFAVGAYTVALAPQFIGNTSFEVLILLALVASAIVSMAFGYIAVRLTRIFFAIMTLALTQLVWALILKLYWYTGGSDGVNVRAKPLLGIPFNEFMSRPEYLNTVFYYYLLGIFAISLFIIWLIVNSPFGRALLATRENETRAEFVGIRVRLYRWYAFIISGVFTGLAGALFAVLNGHVTPEQADWIFSGDIVFVAVLGGFRFFEGPILGSIIFTFVRQYAMGYAIFWRLILGSVLIVLILAFPSGIMGALNSIANRIRAGSRVLPAATTPTPTAITDIKHHQDGGREK
ncbi:MAG: branched-chain amino acid ABC transporter permease [Aigarchaeota archaeon]|nr:branched-chain amino acid ABC transporter permease [Candidatus Pelearchaeum maunauluense]